MPRLNTSIFIKQLKPSPLNQLCKVAIIDPQPLVKVDIDKSQDHGRVMEEDIVDELEAHDECENKLKIKGNRLFEWTREEEKLLFQLHDKMGNKWTQLAEYFPERTDNCVKNHFYSRFRMSFRHLNKYIQKNSSYNKKIVKIHILYKIMSICQQRFNPSSQYTSQFIEFSNDLKQKIVTFLYYNQQDILSTQVSSLNQNSLSLCFTGKSMNEREIIDLVDGINKFNHLYKARREILKVPKKKRQRQTKQKTIQPSHSSSHLQIQQQQPSSSSLHLPLFQMQEISQLPKPSSQTLHELLLWDESLLFLRDNSHKDLKIIQEDQYLFDESNENYNENSFSSRGQVWDRFV